MKIKKIINNLNIILITSPLFLASCNADQPSKNAKSFSADSPIAQSLTAPRSSTNFVDKYIAYHHYLELKTPQNLIGKYWSEDQKRCQLPNCEIVYADFKDANIDQNASYSKAILKIKIKPDLYPQFSADILKRSDVKVGYCKTETENKKREVLDLESRLKSLDALKKKLLLLLDTHSKANGIQDILAVEKELSRVQQEIEQLTSQFNAVNETIEKVSVDIEYQSSEEKSGMNYYFEPVYSAFKHGLRDFGEGLGSAISFIFISLPWLLFVLPFVWIVLKILRIAKLKLSETKLFNKNKDNNSN